jgi:acetylornithine deacetylase/succinyl-diaminopimelate desuccinylase-like protein
MQLTHATIDRVRQSINRQRLIDTAVRLIAVPSRTGEARAVCDSLASLLAAEGFAVERPEGGYPQAPAVAVRHSSGKPGRVLQFNGHLDTVHLPFVPPKVEGERITGSGSSDMKAGVAAAVEALRVLRETQLLPGGGILLTAHDLHEAPWGDGRQLNQMIADGYVGDAVFLPEYLNDRLPVIGRGGIIWKVKVRRPGPPVHEVMRPMNEPNVLAAAARLVLRLGELDQKLTKKADPMAGAESLFIGQVHGGEIFNQYPQECLVEGTRRWLPGTKRTDAENELRALTAEVARETGTTIDLEIVPIREAFVLDTQHPFVSAFQEVYSTIAGVPLAAGPKPFVDDGNSFWALANVPAITHGPTAGGAHTMNEWVSIDDLVRVALVYALTAIAYCGS